METLTSAWASSDACDLVGVGEASCVWEECVFNRTPPAGDMWAEQLSPHLQRNKQLQDTLLQREEELIRLQEENSKLREFLNSSFVRNLQEKSKLTARKLKRNLMHDHGSFHNVGLQASPQVSKRVCRNLASEFRSESPATSEPALDLWVLRTLGLKDRDTIDGSSAVCQQSLSVTPPPSYHQSSPVESECSYRSSEGPLSYADSLTPVHMWTRTGSHEDAERRFSQTPRGPYFCSSTQPFHSAYWSPWTASPVESQSWTQGAGHSDLAFSMSLSPSSSVKTLSFPQGQAFVRRDPQGCWNFTWVPTQTSHNALG
ncbi:geminin coiled-coil domain-containing protein 1 [Dunckerocampus dactyliophorus]|uniref:geminin coiled-coil domain-containing protein 1 n=1 Tax=Dunckerocampus dactyliophorus TaxID=161453 RepID=UPI0024076280|nr:geminin coiled-coil domain-containing protein 1 [Dunckerocampus dactyliophorus]XP_054649468.1 geminin coiled-coil domain-containing protein 1 [Dunckerocampus dactyliophorus]XP_054649469.1 geminin coiled-coil domain-containing protein 1 [Dunckerocampus dactyliophorus]XP_054649470.1 geminin coiled-coil domain-containing protein 1 [Dunckerocampus dactyliophorus]XP_054649472.1 geminin coiled-coil domain-containing protein 1 [Dunckerocampus dactyliophorus]